MLLVDDDELITRSLGRALLALHPSFEIEVAESAQQALSALSRAPFDALITDLQMPGLSGLDLQRHLLTEGHRTPVIFITAFPEETYRNRALNAGAVGFLSKPFDDHALVNCLERALTGPSGKGVSC